MIRLLCSLRDGVQIFIQAPVLSERDRSGPEARLAIIAVEKEPNHQLAPPLDTPGWTRQKLGYRRSERDLPKERVELEPRSLIMRQLTLLSGLVFLVAVPATADELRYKDRLLGDLVKKVPEILRSFDSKTGAFGSGIWICRDQHPMYPLAVAYATQGDGNRYYKDPELLKVIINAADPLI
jgi:hypothetical protein